MSDIYLVQPGSWDRFRGIIGSVRWHSQVFAEQCWKHTYRSSRRVLRRVLNRTPETRGVPNYLYGDDTFLVSYPKSGNTWLRFLVACLVYGKERDLTLSGIEHFVPDIYKHGEGSLAARPRPRYIKTHHYYDPRLRRVIYLVRDPRDILISYYYYQIKMCRLPERFPLNRYAELFLAGKVDKFANWKENVGGWMGARAGSPNFLLLRYENLLDEPEVELIRIARFLNIEVEPKRLREIVCFCAFDQMKQREQEQNWTPGGKRPMRSGHAFFREGKSGGWRAKLGGDTLERMYAQWGEVMEMVGYTQR